MGEEGQALSGGQLARVAIARKLVKNLKVLIFLTRRSHRWMFE